ncbi:hypothetical protein [Brevundimonas sp. DWR2-3-1b1]|uniref:hypothetical protein n=1 Tax=unclassified Brevundimonas TaxID=2622653 RepID=UPI003CF68A67
MPNTTTAMTVATTPTRFGLGVVLEHAVCESLNAVGVPTDTSNWLGLPGQPAEILFRRAVAHLCAALQGQHYGVGYWTADLEPAGDDQNGRYRVLIGDAWVTTVQAVTFRARSVELQGVTVHLSAKNAGRRVVRLLAQAAASTLVPARREVSMFPAPQ